MKGEIYHVEIIVSNIGRSAAFYDGFLGWLGYRKIYVHAKELGWGLGSCNFWVQQCGDRYAHHGYHRRRVGVNHIAFHADSRKMVDQILRAISSI